MPRSTHAPSPPQITPETIVSWYKHMVTLQHMDQLLYNAQRQGRVSFYMTASGGEEGQKMRP